MTETADEALLRKARDMAKSLAITLYIRDGQIYQHGPGIKIDPPVGSGPELVGRGPIAGATE